MRYQAPQHTSGVFAPSGEYRADQNGVIELPDDAPDCDHAAMRAAGCVALGASAAFSTPAPEASESAEEAPGAPESALNDDVSAKAKTKA